MYVSCVRYSTHMHAKPHCWFVCVLLVQIVSVKVPPGRGCGFVQYTTKDAAEVAIGQMNGTVIGGVKVRCAWGRSAAVRAAAASGGASGYYQQYPNYQQSGYQNYYGYGGYYPQYQQVGGYGGYGGYGNYDQQGSQQHGGYQQHGHQSHHHHGGHQRHQEPRDFTRPDDIESMNRRYASQRAYQVCEQEVGFCLTRLAHG